MYSNLQLINTLSDDNGLFHCADGVRGFEMNYRTFWSRFPMRGQPNDFPSVEY